MSGKLHLICMKTEGFHAKIRCNLNDISYLSETQKNYFGSQPSADPEGRGQVVRNPLENHKLFGFL